MVIFLRNVPKLLLNVFLNKGVSNEGFTTVKRNGSQYKRVFGVAKNVEYRPVASKNTKTSPPNAAKEASKQPSKVAEVINTANTFDALCELDKEFVVSEQESVTVDAVDSPSNTPIVEKIN